MKNHSALLKGALFVTGFSGIVAEYVLSTMASYFLGDSVLQWTMIMSVMLFSMGLGSRLSKLFNTKLLLAFVCIEVVLSLFVSFSAVVAYTMAAFTIYSGFAIYVMSIIIGLFIGMEIPLVIRLNDEFEVLRVNVASVVEKDYYGSLVGGFFFAMVGLPYLGLTYTPFVLGFLNFMVALSLFLVLKQYLSKAEIRNMFLLILLVGCSICVGAFKAQKIILFGEQSKYKDKVVFEQQSKYQKIVITQWKDDFWIFINSNQQLCTLDEVAYHEPLVHPAMKLAQLPQQVLVMGGGDGCALREILKYPSVKEITLVDLDPAMTTLGATHPLLTKLNQHAFQNPKVKVLNQDGYNYIQDTPSYFDVIIIDLPDPKTIELGRLYSYEFYTQCYRHLRPNGVIITQAGSPYYATKAFVSIDKSFQAAGFSTLRLHNQILTLGEWGWILGVKQGRGLELKKELRKIDFSSLKTQWLNNEAIELITSFGKNIYPNTLDTDSVEVNSVHHPVLYKYYLKGNWDIY